MSSQRSSKNAEIYSSTAEKKDPIPAIVVALGTTALVISFIGVVNDDVRKELGSLITQTVPVCDGDRLLLTRQPTSQDPNITVDLKGDNPCVVMRVPFTATVASAATIDGEKVNVQSVLPEHLRESGYLSKETLDELQKFALDGEPIWVQHFEDTTEK